MSPLNRVTWRNAFLKRAAQATLMDGRKFNIKYKKMRVYGESVDVAWLHPDGDRFAPCGYVRMEKVLDKLWLTEAGNEDGPPGLYIRLLDQFIDSELIGANVAEEYEEMQGRQLQTMRRGFITAKSARGMKADHVRVVTNEGELFLLKGEADDSDE